MLRFIAYSDYLCPWCWNASRRLLRLEDDYAGRVVIDWRSYLLRPEIRPDRDLEKFREYTKSWRRPAEEPDSGPFRVWSTNAPPPSSSLPPQCAAKAAARISRNAFRSMHEGMLTAYFAENRDISDVEELRRIWSAAGLPADAFDGMQSSGIEAEVWKDFEEARTLGATGVPGLRRGDNEIIIVGAQPLEVYRRWIEKSLADGISTA